MMQPHLTGVWQAVRSRTAAPPRGAGCLGALALWLLLAGCSPQNIDDAYGKRRGAVGGASVNGTAVLAEMFRAAGHRVISWRRLSPKLYGFDILVWVPDDDHPPELPQRQFLEDWLGRRGGRTLVYVGHDYDAAVDYWQKARPLAPPGQVMETARRLALRQAQNAARCAALPEEEPADWFTVHRDQPPRQVRELAGPWAEGVDAQRQELQLHARLAIPEQTAIDEWMARDAAPAGGPPRFERLLASGAEPLVTRITLPAWGDSQILVVANGSFLLNFPLINHEHRKLAGKLVAACGPTGKVVFLESGPGGPTVYDDEPDADGPTGFEIFTVWPVGLIVLHLTVLGITACLALFPIFGRPRQLEDDSPADFGKHVQALGELLEATHDQDYALQSIQHYRDLTRQT